MANFSHNMNMHNMFPLKQLYSNQYFYANILCEMYQSGNEPTESHNLTLQFPSYDACTELFPACNLFWFTFTSLKIHCMLPVQH